MIFEQIKDLCIYAHYIEGIFYPFYVGQGTKERAYSILRRSNKYKQFIKDKEIIVRILKDGIKTKAEAFDIENLIIEEYKELNGCEINQLSGRQSVRTKRGTIWQNKNNYRWNVRIQLNGKKHLWSEKTKQEAEESLEKFIMENLYVV